MFHLEIHRHPTCFALLLFLAVAACGPSPGPGPSTISLVERWATVRIDRPTTPSERPPRAEIRFDGTGLSGVQWSAVEGVEKLRIENGQLVGETTSTKPMILLEIPEPIGVGDELWSLRIQQWADAGSKVGAHPIPAETPIPMAVAQVDAWPLTSPLIPGGKARTYSPEMRAVFLFGVQAARSGVTRILVRPTDAAGARFGIASLRLLFRGERRQTITSGPGWHGLEDVYRETLVSRSPETLGFETALPENPWLELAVGSIDEEPPRFRVEIAPARGGVERVAELEVEPERWRSSRLDLGRWAGETVEIRLTAVAEREGALAFWGAPTVRAAVPRKRQAQVVILFLADTLRRDHLDAWGYGRETAPNLTRLAAEGTLFADAIAQATWTKASVPSMLTSLYPSTVGVTDFHHRVSPAETTLAEAFRTAGYATFGTSSVPFSGRLTNLHQGYDVFLEAGSSHDDGGYASKTARPWVTTFLDWLGERPDVPVFALLHVMDPHAPFRPRPPYDVLWSEPEDIERFQAQAERLRPHIEHPFFRRFLAPNRAELAAAGVEAESFVAQEKAWYDGSIRAMDAEIGRLLDRLETLGLAESTVFAFASDHGEEFLDHGDHWHGLKVYGEATNVPLLLWGRGVPDGRVVRGPVQNLDLMPTLLDLAEIPIPNRVQGRSLVPRMSSPGAPAPPAFVEGRQRESDGPLGYDRLAVVDGRWKLIWNLAPPEGVPEHELYDYEDDPLDQRDLAGEHPEVVERLAGQLARWQRHAGARKLEPEELTAELSTEELNRLRSLGYI